MTFKPTGVYAACVTPFRDDESIDFARLETHIDFMLERGISGLLTIGGTGEYANLTAAERREVVERTIKITASRVPVIVGALGPSTREALDVGDHAVECGADALLVLPPYYIKPSFDGVYSHFETIAKETDLPIVAYNIPSRTGWPLGLDHLIALSEISNVTSVKECERDLASISLKIAELGDRLAVLSGDDDLGFATLLTGARGAIWTSANLFPKLCVDLYNACLSGDVETALSLHTRLVKTFVTYMLPNHPGPMKQAMELVGRGVGPARRPLALMTESQRAAVQDALKANGPIE